MATGPGNTRQRARRTGTLSTSLRAFRGTLSSRDGVDFWRVDLSARSSLTANLSGINSKANADLEIQNSRGGRLFRSARPRNRAENIATTPLDAGTYYVRAFRRTGTTKYVLRLSATPAPLPPIPVTPTPVTPTPVTPTPVTPIPVTPTPVTPTPVTPTPVTPDLGGSSFDDAPLLPSLSFNTQSRTDSVGDTDTADFLQFVVPGSGQLKLQLFGSPPGADIELYDSNRTLIAPISGDGNTGDSITRLLSGGDAGTTFYVKILQIPGSGTTDYTLNSSIVPLDLVPNDFVSATTPLPLTVTTPPTARQPFSPTQSPTSTELTASNFVGGGDVDVYRFDLTSQSFAGIDLTNIGGNADIKLYKANGPAAPIELLSSTRPSTSAEQLGGTLSQGTYYIQVTSADPNIGSPYTLSLFAENTNGLPSISRDISFGDSSADATNLTKVGSSNSIFFAANNNTPEDGLGKALWKSSGGSGGGTLDQTIKVKSFSQLSQFVDVGGLLYFVGDDGAGQRGLWKSDGTLGGTQFITSVKDAAQTVNNILSLTAVGNKLYFVAPSATLTDPTALRIWTSDGTVGGTTEVTQADNSASGLSPTELVNVNGTLFYVANDPVLINGKGRELWRVNTTTGKAELIDIYEGTGPGPASSSDPVKLTAIDDNLFLVATDGFNREVHRVKITGAQFDRATDLTVFDTDGSNITSSIGNLTNDPAWNFAKIASNVYFSAITAEASSGELFKVDLNGTVTNGSGEFTKVSTGASPVVQGARQLTVLGNKLFFKGVNPTTSREELWVTNGTNSTSLLSDRDAAADNSPVPLDFTINEIIAVSGKLYFTTDGVDPVLTNPADPTDPRLTGRELWRVNDAGTGVQLVYDIYPEGTTTPAVADDPLTPEDEASPAKFNPETSLLANLTDVGGQLFFTATNGLNGIEVWSIFA